MIKILGLLGLWLALFIVCEKSLADHRDQNQDQDQDQLTTFSDKPRVKAEQGNCERTMSTGEARTDAECIEMNETFVEECESGSVIHSASDVIIVPDIHGDFEGFIRALRAGNVIPSNDPVEWTWIAGSAVVVQTGDVFDRGPDTLGIFLQIQQLQQQAKDSGGCFVVLMGNHELMNLQGDFRYASASETKGFGGLDKRKQMMEADHEFGQYLRKLRLSVIVRQQHSESNRHTSTVFAHAGLLPAVLELFHDSVEEMNSFSHEKLQRLSGRALTQAIYSDPKSMEVFTTNGPLWTRYLASNAASIEQGEACETLLQVLSTLQVDRMVVGHTVQHHQKPGFKCNEKLILGDVGMSKYYGGGRHFIRISARDGKAHVQS